MTLSIAYFKKMQYLCSAVNPGYYETYIVHTAFFLHQFMSVHVLFMYLKKRCGKSVAA